MIQILTIQLAFDCEPEQVHDAANETLRELQRSWSPQSCLLDYQFLRVAQVPVKALGYCEGDAFSGRHES